MNDKFEVVSGFSIKGISDSTDKITIEGFANTTDKDRVGDVITEEAWVKGGLNNYLKNPILLAYHDHTKPIGEVVDYNVGPKGLHIVAEISKTAGEVYDLAKEGILKAFSVGFRIKDAEYDSDTDTFNIRDLELLEISVVSVPANQDSLFSVSKSFDKTEEYAEFKKQFEVSKDADTEVIAPNSEEKDIEDEKAKQAFKDLAASLEAVKNDLKSIKDTAEAKAEEARVEAEKISKESKEKERMAATEKETGLEALVKELEGKLKASADSEASVKSSLEGLLADLEEKADEIRALQENKLKFTEREAAKNISDEDKETAVLIAMLTGKSLDGTAFGASITEKVGSHVTTAGAEWENLLSTNIYNEMRNKLVVEPLFRTIKMNSATMQIPYSGNPLGSDATWIAGGLTDNTSTGTSVTDSISDLTLTARKVAAKDTLLDEEEEDAILPIIPLIRDTIVTRIARKVDNTLLLSDGTTGELANAFKGIYQYAVDASLNTTTVSAATGSIAATDLHALRTQLSTYATNPSEIVYIISVEAYYDLLNDSTSGLVTVDTYGDRATIIQGEIGSIWGSKVLVSNEFAAKANGAAWGICLNASNFLKGELRSLKVESERTVQSQSRVLVATRRLGFLQMTADKGVSTGVYIA